MNNPGLTGARLACLVNIVLVILSHPKIVAKFKKGQNSERSEKDQNSKLTPSEGAGGD